MQDLTERRCLAERFFRCRLCARPAGSPLPADAGIQCGLRDIMAVLKSKSPGRRLSALYLDFRIINVVTRPAGLNILSQHRFLRPVTMQYPAQLHAQILTLATVW
jgi:hypothetical protein